MDVGEYNNEMEMKKKKLFTAAILNNYYRYQGVSHWDSKQKKAWLNSRFKCRIEYFKDGVSLGEFPCLEASNSEIRDAIAEYNGVGDYDCCVLDGDRVSFVKRDGREYMRYRKTGTMEGTVYERLIPNKQESRLIEEYTTVGMREPIISIDLEELLSEREVSSMIP